MNSKYLNLTHNTPEWIAYHRDSLISIVVYVLLIIAFVSSLIYTVSFNGWLLKVNKNSFRQAFIFQKYNEQLTLDKYQISKKIKVLDISLTFLISVITLVIFSFGFVIFAGWFALPYFATAIYVPGYFLGFNIYRLVKLNKQPKIHAIINSVTK